MASRLAELKREAARVQEERKAQLAAEQKQTELLKRATSLLQEIENQADWLDSTDDETVKRARFFIREKLSIFESEPELMDQYIKESEVFSGEGC